MNIKSYFHSSVTLTKGFGDFSDSFGRVKGPPGTQNRGGNKYIHRS